MRAKKIFEGQKKVLRVKTFWGSKKILTVKKNFEGQKHFWGSKKILKVKKNFWGSKKILEGQKKILEGQKNFWGSKKILRVKKFLRMKKYVEGQKNCWGLKSGSFNCQVKLKKRLKPYFSSILILFFNIIKICIFYIICFNLDLIGERWERWWRRWWWIGEVISDTEYEDFWTYRGTDLRDTKLGSWNFVVGWWTSSSPNCCCQPNEHRW